MGIPAEDRPELFWLVDPNDYLRPIAGSASCSAGVDGDPVPGQRQLVPRLPAPRGVE